MTVTTVEPTTIEDLDFQPGCEGWSGGNRDQRFDFECSEPAELIKIRRCGCSSLVCLSCRNKCKAYIEERIALGELNFFCGVCHEKHRGMTSYYEIVIQEVLL